MVIILLVALAYPVTLKAQNSQRVDIYKKVGQLDLVKVIFPDTVTNGYDYRARHEIVGYIDTNYQRFQIHFTSITQNPENPYQYFLKGKTKVRNNICDFEGTLKVLSSTKFDSVETMVDIGPTNFKIGEIRSEIVLNEERSQQFSGSIKGNLYTSILIDTMGRLQYNAFHLEVSDGYCNNQFTGVWTSYTTGKSRKCNWGDYRIPDCGDLDMGAGFFSPADKYLKNGWLTYRAMINNKPEDQEAIRVENAEWWK
jgi:hypothetical protein